MSWVIRRDLRGSVRYTAVFRDSAGRQRSAGTFDSLRAAKKAGRAAEDRVHAGTWVDPADGRISFADFTERVWLPQLRVEVSTLAAYRCYLRAHFLPSFGRLPLNKVSSELVQGWVDQSGARLSPTSVVKYHAMLSSLFAFAVDRRYCDTNPCLGTHLPATPRRVAVARMRRILTPAEFEVFLRGFSPRHQVLLLTGVETGLRWGELIGLRPAHLDLEGCRIHVQQVIVEVSAADSPTGQRYLVKEYPKDREARTVAISAVLAGLLAEHVRNLGLDQDDLLFTLARGKGQPMSRHTFRKRHWLPAVTTAGLPFSPTPRDLRHAHASWLVAAGVDVETVRERLGHGWLTTTQLYVHSLLGADEEAVVALEDFRARYQLMLGTARSSDTRHDRTTSGRATVTALSAHRRQASTRRAQPSGEVAGLVTRNPATRGSRDVAPSVSARTHSRIARRTLARQIRP